MWLYSGFLLFLWVYPSLASEFPQLPLSFSDPRHLTGRFLHITDLHPDGHYKPHTAKAKACHRQRKKKGTNIAGYYGLPYSKCDSPFTLTDMTLDYIGKEWAKSIDFVVWTGDNARHDNDRKVPRTQLEIYDLNRSIAKKMDQHFLSKGIPVIPSLGNNDIWPHNILTPGPNGITNEFSNIWSKFIPFHHLQVFQRGAYFAVEVIPDSLVVISLNTMYFYDSNKAVEGCPYTEPNDPGNLEFDWLEVQLEMYRSRDMKVYLTGHVPPSPGNYWEQCYVRYVELSLRFQDTIIGHLYGHMNDDFFFFLDAQDLEIPRKVEPLGSKRLFETLMTDFGALSKKAERYAVVNVSPSVVPNPYIPTFRIFSYNATGGPRTDLTVSSRHHGHRKGNGDKKKLCKEERYQETWRCHLKNTTWHNEDETAPSRGNGLWTPLGYAQYYLPGIGEARKKRPPRFKMEYLTYKTENLHPLNSNDTLFQYPVPVKHLPGSLRKPNNNGTSKFAPYSLEDLTIASWLELGRRLGGGEDARLRRIFRKYMRVQKKRKSKKLRGDGGTSIY